MGVESGKPEDFSGKDKYATFCIGKKMGEEDIENPKKPKNKEEPLLRKINVNNSNPFRRLESEEEKKIGEIFPGSPIYFRDFVNGAYVIAIINSSFEFQYINNFKLLFLKNIKRKLKKNINTIKWEMSKQNLCPIDIKYFIEYNFNFLKILDLSYNSIGIQGAFYLSNGKFNCLESLNLNCNELYDKGVLNISKSCFPKLQSLFLLDNIISDKGIKYLIKANLFWI